MQSLSISPLQSLSRPSQTSGEAAQGGHPSSTRPSQSLSTLSPHSSPPQTLQSSSTSPSQSLSMKSQTSAEGTQATGQPYNTSKLAVRSA